MAAVAAMGVSVAPLGGCAGSGGVGGHAGGEGVGGPFAPVTLRIYPLTRVEVDPSGDAQVVFHFELADGWGDAVKAPGVLTVRAFRVGAGVGEGLAGGAAAELTWEVDLTDPEANSFVYDPATSTYRVRLGRLPAWAERLVPGGSREGGLRLRAAFRTTDARGQTVYLNDEYLIGG